MTDDRKPSKDRDKSFIAVITEGIAFFLAGAFLIGTTTTTNSDDLLVQRLTYVAQYTGYILLAFGVIYVLPIIPWFRCIKSKIEKGFLYIYPLVFAITSLQVLQIVLDPQRGDILRWISGIFVLIIILLIMFTPTSKSTDKTRLLLNLVLTYTLLSIIFIALRAETLLSLIQSPILEPLTFLIVSFICCLLLYKRTVKKEEQPDESRNLLQSQHGRPGERGDEPTDPA